MNQKFLHVTHVGKLGCYLKIVGFSDNETFRDIQTSVKKALQIAMPIGNNIFPEMFCLAKKNGMYCRSRVKRFFPNVGTVEVEYIDFGHTGVVPHVEVLVGNFPQELRTYPPICSDYHLMGIYNDWMPEQLAEIGSELINQLIEIREQTKIANLTFVRVSWKRFDLAEYLIYQKKLGAPVSDAQLKENLLIHNSKRANTTVMGTANNPFSQSEPELPKRVHVSAVRPARQLHPSTTGASAGFKHSFRALIQGVNNDNNRIPFTGLSQPEYNAARQSRSVDNSMSAKRTGVTFKSNTVMVGSVYDVACCFVENGPRLFTVQLKSTENELVQMMAEIEKLSLENLSEEPSIGMACIARFSEDGQLYRAVISSIKPTACGVDYVDYGNSEIVPFNDLYNIPPKYLEYKAFALKFSLSGCRELEPLDDYIKNAFKDLVLYNDLKLKVTPLEGPPCVQYGELYLNDVNVMQTLKKIRNTRSGFKEPEPLASDDAVVIRYIDSPKSFYVQKEIYVDAFNEMMDQLEIYCSNSKRVPPNLVKGLACAVKYKNEWYRAEIAECAGDEVFVRHVDYGYGDRVKSSQLCVLPDKMAKLPRQAIKCCLQGFENSESIKDITIQQFEMLAEESNGDRRSFMVKVFQRHEDGSYLVNLMTKELDISKKLHKLSMPLNKYISLEKEQFGAKSTSNAFVAPTAPAPVAKTTAFKNSSNEWDRHSNSSSENRDSRSSSSEFRGNRNGLQKQPRDNRDTFQKSDNYRNINNNNNHRWNANEASTSMDKRVFNDNRNGPRNFDGKPAYQPRNLPPRLQNKVNECDATRRFSSSNRKPDMSFNNQKSTSPSDRNQSSGASLSLAEDYIPLDQQFPRTHIQIPSKEEVVICWWISPHQFYTHLKSRTDEFEEMMRSIQQFYKNKPPNTLPLKVGSCVIARYRQDKILYRARILACNQMLRKYKVQFVDFGNQLIVADQDIWQVDKRFANLPCMAYMCSFLGVVSNFDHAHITSQVEKFLTVGSLLVCDYIDREEDLYYVNVSVNSSSFKKLLLNEGLISEVNPETRLCLLVGQQIRVKITTVRDMLNFQILIEGCDVQLLCSYYDIKFVKSNQNLTQRFKEVYEGKSCVFEVTDVTPDQIIMVKPLLPLFKNDIPRYICPYPIIRETFQVRMVHVKSATRAYAHITSEESVVAQLLEDMFNYYDKNGNNLPKPEVGTICAVKSCNGAWYRARILSVGSPKEVEVFYLDYGKTETIVNDNEQDTKLKRLENEFCSKSSSLAIEINLPINCTAAADDGIAIMEEVYKFTSGQECTVRVIEMRGNRLIADICVHGRRVTSHLKDKGLIVGEDLAYVQGLIDEETPNVYEYIETVDLTLDDEASASNTTAAVSENPVAEMTQEVTLQGQTTENTVAEVTLVAEKPTVSDNLILAHLSHCDNPGQFYLNLDRDMSGLAKLQENLQIVASSLPPLMRIVKGANCISLFSVDKQWYRAKIVDSELMVVQFIDYGNTDALTDATEIKEMSVFPDLKPFCIPCSLPVKPKGSTDWPDEANQIFNESFDKPIQFEFITQNEKKNFINLFIDGVNVADKLVADGYAVPLEVLKSGENCFVSHVNNLNEFYIQLEKDSHGLDLIENHLADFESLPVIESFTKDLICAALFADDECWYRAKLLAENSDGYDVLFIDYGNTATSKQIREIPKEMAAVPPLSKKCALRLPDNVADWSEEAESKFSEIAALGETVFTLELKLPGDHATVDLFLDGRNLLEDLEPLCPQQSQHSDLNASGCTNLHLSITEQSDGTPREATISHIESPCEFYVQFISDSNKLDDMMASLSEISMPRLDEPTLGSTQAALFSDDNAYYRATILEKINDEHLVFFVDYGNKSMSSDVRDLPDDLRNIGHFATQCSLENASVFANNAEAASIFNEILANNEFVANVEIVDKESTPWVVKLWINERNVCQILNERLKASEMGNMTTDSLVVSQTNNDESLLVDDMKDCSVIHFNSPNDFYIRYAEDEVQAEQITEMLIDAVSFEPVVDPKVGDICAAQFPDDGGFYRAKILEVNGMEYEVIFTDFGNTSTTTEIRVLPDNLEKIKCLAKHCTLENLESKPCIDGFSEFINAHIGDTFQSRVVSDSTDLSIVQLFHEKKNVIDSIIQNIPGTIEDEKIITGGLVSEAPGVDSDSSQKSSNAPINPSSGVSSADSSFTSDVIVSESTNGLGQVSFDREIVDDLKRNFEAIRAAKEFEKLSINSNLQFNPTISSSTSNIHKKAVSFDREIVDDMKGNFEAIHAGKEFEKLSITSNLQFNPTISSSTSNIHKKSTNSIAEGAADE